MNDETFIFVIVLAVLVPLLVICLIVILVRWLFRINPAIELLEKINGNLNVINSPWHKCESCGCLAPDNYFQKIDSGQMICNDCRSDLKS
ncbi:MAG: hypothetical protein WC364_13875 [Eubacteriales bacterium]|jgi:hypothetical protein